MRAFRTILGDNDMLAYLAMMAMKEAGSRTVAALQHMADSFRSLNLRLKS